MVEPRGLVGAISDLVAVDVVDDESCVLTAQVAFHGDGGSDTSHDLIPERLCGPVTIEISGCLCAVQIGVAAEVQDGLFNGEILAIVVEDSGHFSEVRVVVTSATAAMATAATAATAENAFCRCSNINGKVAYLDDRCCRGAHGE